MFFLVLPDQGHIAARRLIRENMGTYLTLRPSIAPIYNVAVPKDDFYTTTPLPAVIPIPKRVQQPWARKLESQAQSCRDSDPTQRQQAVKKQKHGKKTPKKEHRSHHPS